MVWIRRRQGEWGASGRVLGKKERENGGVRKGDSYGR